MQDVCISVWNESESLRPPSARKLGLIFISNSKPSRRHGRNAESNGHLLDRSKRP